MKAVKIDGEARPVGAPPDWKEDEHGRCQALFVREDIDGGLKFMRSAWEPSADEIGWLLAGSNIQLGISAPAHPVVNMGVGPAPLEGSPVYTVRQIANAKGEPMARVSMYAPRAEENKKIGGSVWVEIPISSGGIPAAVKTAFDWIEQFAAEKGIA